MSGAYGKQLGEFVGVNSPPTITAKLLQGAEVATTHLCWEDRGSEVATRIGTEDAFLVFLQRRAIPSNPYWIDDRPVDMKPLARGESLILNLNQEHRSIVSAAVDCVAFYVPRPSLDRVAYEQGLQSSGSLRSTLGDPVHDSLIWHLGECLVRAFETSNDPPQLFIDSLSLALIAHLCSVHSENAQPRLIKGGLAPWQERRAKELLLSHLQGDIGLEELAAQCHLSRSHFARAFKATTGVSPLRWLHFQRIESAKRLLLNSDHSLDRIAVSCGFSDSSHLARSFRTSTGASPGMWRRVRRT